MRRKGNNMKLYIKRDQDSGFFGGISFLLSSRVQLTNEEMELIKKYKAHKTTLFTANNGTRPYTISDMLDGVTFKCKDVTEILQYEDILKESCRTFDTLVKVMISFGGEEEIDFNK